MNINVQRLSRRLAELSEIGKIEETGVCRPALSPVEKRAFDLVGGWMEEAGMKVRIDDFGNLIGRLDGEDAAAPVLMIGSHLDSQPYGGRFDGAAGVLAGVEAAAALADQGIRPVRPVEVVSFCDEEGWRWGKGLFGSRGITGQLDLEELSRVDKDGVTREQALRDFGCDPDRMAASVYPPGSIHAYLELHIEQGPLLDRLQVPLGVVTGISGPVWLTVEFLGFAGHAGSVPMSLRRDALVGAAEAILALRRIVAQEEGSPGVGTVGDLKVFPNSRNIIPEAVTFTVDLRDIDLERRHRYERELRETIASIAVRHGLDYTIRDDFRSEPRYCAEWIQSLIREEGRRLGYDLPALMSGPFHDALALSYVCDYGMIFVRCKNGISHNPLEFTSTEDLALGTELLFRTVRRMIQTKPVERSWTGDKHE
ncbi:M20 family metallo-hydrolase [Kyrpidia spormannii]|uniref:N-carbamoyl-L-amino-acid hydrolase n=1 Tax=Kyrpidia spormannii TaxID=2055160 RepID=A0A6F9EHV7_9BACL|nr:M20 family metallo-hydrolase [Kyrpidia spormannii]CAB3396072.1 N-carbamoyl-L-amino-acid hydrolase [Kyrpidia spormannii]